tara:strand:- start:247 stop:480 length:234 start_codon:yes stop_codon:yes gene_type:complete
MDEIDNYSHRLSIKNHISYESARDMLEQSVVRLENYKYNSDNLIRSAYKYSKVKLNKQNGGSKKNKLFSLEFKMNKN